MPGARARSLLLTLFFGLATRPSRRRRESRPVAHELSCSQAIRRSRSRCGEEDPQRGAGGGGGGSVGGSLGRILCGPRYGPRFSQSLLCSRFSSRHFIFARTFRETRCGETRPVANKRLARTYIRTQGRRRRRYWMTTRLAFTGTLECRPTGFEPRPTAAYGGMRRRSSETTIQLR